jgi:two-component system, NtrC family, response regulator HydG
MTARLLIVDDESEIRNSLARRYRLKGYLVDTAGGGEDALHSLELQPYHVVISDIKMPGIDGIELLRRIKVEYPMTRVIIMTGYVTLENGLACLRHGADTCIFKPFEDLKEMDDAIIHALNYLASWEQKLLFLNGMKPGGEVHQ